MATRHYGSGGNGGADNKNYIEYTSINDGYIKGAISRKHAMPAQLIKGKYYAFSPFTRIPIINIIRIKKANASKIILYDFLNKRKFRSDGTTKRIDIHYNLLDDEEN